MINSVLNEFDYKHAISVYSDLFDINLTEDDFKDLILDMWDRAVETVGEIRDEYFVDVTADNFLYMQATFLDRRPIMINVFCKILEVNIEENEQSPYQSN